MNNEIRTGGPDLDTVEIYEPQRDHWAPGIPIPTGPAVATIDDRIYITAGIGGTERKPNSDTYVFDPDVGKWEQLAPIPTPRCDPGSLVVDRKIYTFGGWGNRGYYDNVEIYDVDGNGFSAKAYLCDGWRIQVGRRLRLQVDRRHARTCQLMHV